MQQTQYDDFCQAITSLAVALQAKAGSETHKAYWYYLRDLDLEAVQRACLKAPVALRTTYGKLPTVVQLRELSGAMPSEQRALLAWHEVTKAMDHDGTYESVCFDDPVIHAAIRSLGGWEWVGHQTEEWYHIWGRKQFMEVYGVYLTNGISAEQAASLTGIHQRNNALVGITTSVKSIETGLPALPAGTVRGTVPSGIPALAAPRGGEA